MLNSVVKISMMSVKYFKYYTIILRGPFFVDTLAPKFPRVMFVVVLRGNVHAVHG